MIQKILFAMDSFGVVSHRLKALDKKVPIPSIIAFVERVTMKSLILWGQRSEGRNGSICVFAGQ